jgi:hypothetical protein
MQVTQPIEQRRKRFKTQLRKIPKRVRTQDGCFLSLPSGRLTRGLSARAVEAVVRQSQQRTQAAAFGNEGGRLACVAILTLYRFT